LNGAPPGASGGELRAYVGASAADTEGDSAVRVDDIQPRAGRLVLFESRTLLHAVRPVGLWRRVALSLWCLKRIDATDHLSSLVDVLRADAFQHLDAISLARLAACARAFGKKKDGRSLCDEAARQRISTLRETQDLSAALLERRACLRGARIISTRIKSIDGMDWFGKGHVPSWIYCLYDWEEIHIHALSKFIARKKARSKRQKAADEIRNHIILSGSRAAESADEFIVELLQDGPAQMTPIQAREYVANMRRRD